MDREKSRAVFMSLAGIYLGYIGVTLLHDVITDKPDNWILFAVLSVVFIGVGAYVVVSKARMMTQQQEDVESIEETEAGTDEKGINQEDLENQLEMNKDESLVDAFKKEVECIIDENE